MGLFTDNVMGKYNLTLAETPIEAFPRYDFNKPVPPQARYLTPVAWLLSLPAVLNSTQAERAQTALPAAL